MQFREGQFVRQSDSDSEKKKGGEGRRGVQVQCDAHDYSIIRVCRMIAYRGRRGTPPPHRF